MMSTCHLSRSMRYMRRARTAWEAEEKHLLVDWELPDFSVVPVISRFRYIKSDDRETQIPRPAGERKSLYRNALAQSALAVLAEIFRAEHGRMVNMVTINGFVSGADPATGRRNKVFLRTVNVGRQAFARLELARIDSVSCLEGLRGQLSSRPESLVRVHPTRLAVAVESYDDSTSTSSSLLEMDPLDFEDLVVASTYGPWTRIRSAAGNSSSRSSDIAAPSRRLRSGICMARCFTRAPRRESWSRPLIWDQAPRNSPQANR
jgi:hypothetical protein